MFDVLISALPRVVRNSYPPRLLLQSSGAIALAALACAGCASHEAVSFTPRGDQQAIIRDGVPAIVSRRPNSVVLVRPASREFRGGARPVFTVAINNLSREPLEFRVANVQVVQMVNNEPRLLKVISYEELTQEERTRQTVAAMGTGLAVAGNAMAASQAGNYTANSTVSTPRGTYNVQTTGYSPAAAAAAPAGADRMAFMRWCRVICAARCDARSSHVRAMFSNMSRSSSDRERRAMERHSSACLR
jgi:hypothetical protein